MFGRPVSLFSVFGFEIKIDMSWLILAALITWSLASGFFPESYKGLSAAAYWWMGAAGYRSLGVRPVFLARTFMAVGPRETLSW